MIMESKGRIVTTGSIAGIKSFPGCSAYCGSKHWVEAFTDSLASEMAPFGVQVSVVEPGNYQSNIRRTKAARVVEEHKAASGEVTNEVKQAYQAEARRELSYKEPTEVSEAFVHALFDNEPLRRYVVAPNAAEHAWAIEATVGKLVQLNQWGPYGYSRDELISLLDEALSGEVAEE